MPKDLQKVKDLLVTRGCSQRTISNYLSCLNRFKNYYEGKKNLKKLKEEDILNYLKKNFMNIECSPATINVNRAAIKYYYLINFNIDFNKVLLPSCKTKSRFPLLITKEQILTIIHNEKNLKHKLWLILGYGSGLRISEVASLKVSDILSNEHKIKVIGKGNKQRYVPLPNFTLKLLRLYWIKNKNKITKDYLFPASTYQNQTQEHINPTSLQQAFQKMKKLNQIDHSISFHTLRHSFATEYIKSGGDIWELKSLLGHSSINSTMIYLHLAEDFSKISSPLDSL